MLIQHEEEAEIALDSSEGKALEMAAIVRKAVLDAGATGSKADEAAIAVEKEYTELAADAQEEQNEAAAEIESQRYEEQNQQAKVEEQRIEKEVEKRVKEEVERRVKFETEKENERVVALEKEDLKKVLANAEEQVKENCEKQEAKELETKMKFFPGMTQISQLLQWNETTAGPRMGPAKNMEPLQRGKGRIMSLHDMAGGYQEIADNDYLSMFQSWNVVDLFVYFSHVRMSVPPLQWTAIAHEHGRPALGTIIFEPNQESTDAISALRSNREQVLSQLVKVAEHYGFDGWFFNNEAYPSAWHKGEPEKFVKDLKAQLKSSSLGERAQLISYPYGPTSEMFEHSDGVMIDYNWPRGKNAMSHLKEAAGSRAADVYMGMDSFGSLRANTEPDPSTVGLCADGDFSLGVFAPGYTFEHPAHKQYSLLAVDYDRRYWDSIAKNFGRKAEGTGEWPVLWHEELPRKSRWANHADLLHKSDEEEEGEESEHGTPARSSKLIKQLS